MRCGKPVYLRLPIAEKLLMEGHRIWKKNRNTAGDWKPRPASVAEEQPFVDAPIEFLGSDPHSFRQCNCIGGYRNPLFFERMALE
jgi:hypothetical protein